MIGPTAVVERRLEPGPGTIGPACTRRIRARGIRDRPTAARSPWQNGHVERLIGSIRRECPDLVVVFGEAHLRRILKNYASYYDQVRIHLALDKDTPEFRHPQRVGNILPLPVLGGTPSLRQDLNFSVSTTL